ncbi:MAG: phosphate ABC transporter substrate-binding protein [Verrucomicrobiota bacterium]
MNQKLKLLSSVGLAAGFAVSSAVADTIIIKGSDTLGAKMIPQIAEAFKVQHPTIDFAIAAEGSSTGVAAIIDGTADIGMSSRDVKDSEMAKAEANGVNIMKTTVGLDGIAIIVNESNPITDITLDQVEEIFTGDTTDWASMTGKPGQISTYTRNTASGTYAVFKEMGMDGREYAPNAQKMAGNEQIASEVANNPNGIGYVGLAYINTPGVKVVPVDGLAPDNPKYPMARPLFVLTNGFPTETDVAQFMNFSLSLAGQQIVRKNDFIPVK